MTSSPRPVIVGALRTPIGTAGHGLRDVEPHDLAAPVLRALAADPVLVGRPVDQVVLGNCTGPGGDVARVAVLAAGLDVAVPAVTVDAQCGSGLNAIEVAHDRVVARGGLVLCGGVESASTAPRRTWPAGHPRARAGAGDEDVVFTRAPFSTDAHGDPDMGYANDLLASRYGIGRQAQDAYAARSHARAYAAREAGGFDNEVIAVAGLSRDERPREGMTVERLARLRPTYRTAEEGGTVTAGNACGINDGAAAVAMVDDDLHRRLGAPPGLRVHAVATCGVHPTTPGVGPVPAIRGVLSESGVDLDALHAIEINEAFAGQVLACCADLDLDPERVCADGGAIGLGHPWGASGAVLVVRLFSRLVRDPDVPVGAWGLAAIAVGGGQGVAMLLERV